jgi:xylan 1,4-beta-xylosidase
MKKIIISILVVFVSFGFGISQTETRTIMVDVNKVSGPLNNFFNECVGAGRANEGLRADWQQQLRYVKEQLGFRYIRMHGILHDDMGVYFEDENGNPKYNWQYVDALYDYLLSIDVKPFVEFSFMPKAMASGDKTVFWWKGNITPPKDYDKWSNFIKAIVQHWTDRYGENELKKWYFEVWNEPNLPNFWSGSQEDYFKLYNVTAKAVKSVSKDYRVGGPATANYHTWVTETINYCVNNNVPIDFISSHVYGIDKGNFASKKITCYLSQRERSVYGTIYNSWKEIKDSPLPNLKLHYTEWNSSFTPEDPIHDSYHSAAYILDKIKKTGNTANSMSYWTFTDIFEEAGPEPVPFYGGFGLLNTQGIKKSAFYSYQFLNRLGSQELVNKDTTSWICKDKKGNVQILFWNFTITLPGESITDQDYYLKDLPAKAKGIVNIKVENLLPGNYEMKVYKVGYRINDPYTAYLDMGSPAQLSKEQVQKLNSVSNGDPVMTKIISLKDKEPFTQSFDMRENDVYLITMNKF